MRRVVGHLEEKRRRTVLLDECFAAYRDFIRQVAGDFGWLLVVIQVVDRRRQFRAGWADHVVGVIVHGAAAKPPELIEPMAIGARLDARAEMPFPDQASRVTGAFQQPWE